MQHTMVISDEELEVLNELLHTELAESRMEIRHTDDHEYREKIHRRIQTAERLLQKVDVTLVSAGAFQPKSQFSSP